MTKRTWTWISAVAAMLAASGNGLRAQDAPAPPAPPSPPASGMDAGTDSTTSTTTSSDSTTTTTTSDSTMNSGPMNNGMKGEGMAGAGEFLVVPPGQRPPPSDRPDYSVLLDRDYDYQDLKQAKAVGLGDDEVARISLISRMAGVGFRHIRDAVERGVTFYQLVDQYSLDGTLLGDVSDEKLRIASYESAYESTALGGLKRTASAQDVELQASFARFRELNANFPATATASTLVFERGTPPAQTTAAVTTETNTTTVRATRTTETETVEAMPAAKPKPVRVVTHVVRAKRVRTYHRAVRHRTMRVHRHHQVHHHMPVYMRRGS